MKIFSTKKTKLKIRNKFFYSVQPFDVIIKIPFFFIFSFINSKPKINKLVIEKTTNPLPKPNDPKLPFGKYSTDHIFEAEWEQGKGWSTPYIKPYHNLVLDPKASVFHYGLEIFEGLKAYYDIHGKIRIFRPDLNMKRFNKSADRLALPTIDEKGVLEGIKQLLKLDISWFPKELGIISFF